MWWVQESIYLEILKVTDNFSSTPFIWKPMWTLWEGKISNVQDWGRNFWHCVIFTNNRYIKERTQIESVWAELLTRTFYLRGMIWEEHIIRKSILCSLRQILRLQIKEYEMDGACSTYRWDKKCLKTFGCKARGEETSLKI